MQWRRKRMQLALTHAVVPCMIHETRDTSVDFAWRVCFYDRSTTKPLPRGSDIWPGTVFYYCCNLASRVVVAYIT